MIEVKELHLLNTLFPSSLTEFPSETEDNASHPSNALFSIDLTEFPIISVFNVLLSLHTSLEIVVLAVVLIELSPTINVIYS